MEKVSWDKFTEVKSVSSVCIDSVDIRDDGQIDTNLKKIGPDGVEKDFATITSWDKKSTKEQYEFFQEDGLKGCDGTNPDDIFKNVFL